MTNERRKDQDKELGKTHKTDTLLEGIGNKKCHWTTNG